MRIRVNTGTGCSHIHIETLGGQRLLTTTLDGLQDAIRSGDVPLLIGLRFLIKQYIVEGGTPTLSNLKTLIEAKEF